MAGKMKRILALILVFGLVAISAACGADAAGEEQAAAEATETIKVNLAGGSTSGMMFVLCSGISECVNRSYPGSVVTIVPGGAAGNVIRIAGGEVDIATAHSALIHSALKGEAPFEEQLSDITSIASFYASTYQVVIDKSLGIQSFGEIIDKKLKVRISIDQQGSSASVAFDRLLGLYGVDREAFEAWGGRVYMKTQEESASMFADGNIDAYALQTLWPANAIRESGTAKEVMLLPIEPEIVDRMGRQHGYEPITIPAGTYEFLDADYPTFSTSTVLIARSDLPEDAAYKLAKSLAENAAYLSGVHAGLKDVTAARLVQDTGAPLHPGAERYYKEAGVLE